MGRKSREKRERRRTAGAAGRETPRQRFPVNTEYARPALDVTPSEGYLRRLCDKTFLSLWSYPNPFSEPGKELCDLLVAFENHIIVFSDKHCDFPDTGNLDRDWARWYRRAIAKSAHQCWGAERWMRRNPDKVFLDARCEKPFPLPLVVTPDTIFHRIIIAHGASARCRQFFDNSGSGSLMLISDVIGDDHVRPLSQGGKPFTVGRVDVSKGYVHILDDATFVVLLKTLDTVADFTAYLTKKEAFLTSTVLVSAAGEEELLAYYLTHMNASGQHDFVFEDDMNGVAIDEGFWARFLESPQRRSQVAANKTSYAWDYVIERFTRHFLKGTSHNLSDTRLSSQEQLLRWFAREPRTRRRMLANAIIEMVETTPSDMRRLRVLKPSRSGDPYFVLLLLPKPPGIPYAQYRTARENYLDACCRVVRLDNPDALDVVGFATETSESDTGGRSEDAMYFDARTWTEEMAGQTKRDKEVLGI